MKLKVDRKKVELKQRLARILRKSGNKTCADCPEKRPAWISFINPQQSFALGSKVLASFVCIECAGIHRKLGSHICFVRSISLDELDKEDVDSAELSGNEIVNEIFEGQLKKDTMDDFNIKPLLGAHAATRERFIRQKYVELYFYRKSDHYKHIGDVNKIVAESRKATKAPHTPGKKIRKKLSTATSPSLSRRRSRSRSKIRDSSSSNDIDTRQQLQQQQQQQPQTGKKIRKKLSIFLHSGNSAFTSGGCSTTVGNTISTPLTMEEQSYFSVPTTKSTNNSSALNPDQKDNHTTSRSQSPSSRQVRKQKNRGKIPKRQHRTPTSSSLSRRRSRSRSKIRDSSSSNDLDTRQQQQQQQPQQRNRNSSRVRTTRSKSRLRLRGRSTSKTAPIRKNDQDDINIAADTSNGNGNGNGDNANKNQHRKSSRIRSASRGRTSAVREKGQNSATLRRARSTSKTRHSELLGKSPMRTTPQRTPPQRTKSNDTVGIWDSSSSQLIRPLNRRKKPMRSKSSSCGTKINYNQPQNKQLSASMEAASKHQKIKTLTEEWEKLKNENQTKFAAFENGFTQFRRSSA